MPRLPSPCIKVCRFRRDGPEGAGRHCIGCSMTKPQRRAFKRVRGRAPRAALVRLIVLQQAAMGGFRHWRAAYARRCRKKGVASPLRDD